MVLRLFLLICFSLLSLAAADRYRLERRPGAHPLLVLTNETDGVEASISPQDGGELCSLRFRHNNEWIELLYRACDYSPTPGWRGKAPLLWPATGITRGPYSFGGKSYTMPVHGFAQTMPWKVDITKAGPREARALLSLNATPETRKIYPFDWRVTVEYRLSGDRLFLVYTAGASIHNTGKMFFSIGNHITFRTPFLPGSNAGEMRIETPATFVLKKDVKNLPTGETAKPPFENATRAGDLTPNVSLSLGGYPSDPTLVLSDPQGLRVRLKHSAARLPAQPFVQFNLYGDPQAGFFSPEPWAGVQNSFHSRRGLIELDPGQSWQWIVEIHPSVTAKM